MPWQPLEELLQEKQASQESRNMDKRYCSLLKFPKSKHSDPAQSLEKHAKAVVNVFVNKNQTKKTRNEGKEVLTRGPRAMGAVGSRKSNVNRYRPEIFFHKESSANHREGYDESAMFCCTYKLMFVC